MFCLFLGKKDLSRIPAIKYGKDNEKNGIKCLENFLVKKINPSGIWLHETGVLGASPDGLIEDNQICEIKCLPSYEGKLHEGLIGFAPQKILYKENETSSCYMVNKGHDYYHQIQRQLYMTNRNSCWLVLYTTKDEPVFKEIFKDPEWNLNIYTLLQFYHDVYIPTIFKEICNADF